VSCVIQASIIVSRFTPGDSRANEAVPLRGADETPYDEPTLMRLNPFKVNTPAYLEI